MLYQVLTIYLFIVQISWNNHNDISKSSRIIVQILFTSWPISQFGQLSDDFYFKNDSKASGKYFKESIQTLSKILNKCLGVELRYIQ